MCCITLCPVPPRFTPEGCEGTDRPNPIQVCHSFIIFGKHMQNASFLSPIRTIASTLLPEGRKENTSIKELGLLFVSSF